MKKLLKNNKKPILISVGLIGVSLILTAIPEILPGIEPVYKILFGLLIIYVVFRVWRSK